jgi:hypothetical protein
MRAELDYRSDGGRDGKMNKSVSEWCGNQKICSITHPKCSAFQHCLTSHWNCHDECEINWIVRWNHLWRVDDDNQIYLNVLRFQLYPLWDSVRPFLQAEQQDKVENSKNDRNWKKFDRKCSRHITFSLRYYRLYRPWIKRFDPCKSFLFWMTDGVAQQFHDKVQNPAFPRFFSRLIV